MSNHLSSMASWQNVKKTALHWTAQNGNISCICYVTMQNFRWRPPTNPYSVRHLCFSAKVKFHTKRKQVNNINIRVYQKYVSQATVTINLVRFEHQLHQPKYYYDKQIPKTYPSLSLSIIFTICALMLPIIAHACSISSEMARALASQANAPRYTWNQNNYDT